MRTYKKKYIINKINQITKVRRPGPDIILVDDDEAIRDIFAIIFRRAGYSCNIMADGSELMKNCIGLPKLFLIDRQLSGSSGIDLCLFLKSQGHTRKIPIVLISASPDVERLSKEAGADNFLEKPFDMKTLIQMLDNYLKPADKVLKS